ncbi:MAG TPA: CHC2 zinc finger domain-containing protein [Bryobacteraceae bacterium]|nr:CHC2 zinc finger domain-containing protein [Bryobacteraceae bacterium]
MKGWVEFATIKQAAPLMKVLEQYRIGGLRRSGKDQWRGRCPLHDGEGRAAFHVNTARQLFHCFSCRAGGTVLDLVAALEGCGVREAARKLAAWRDLPAAESSGRVSQKQPTVTEKTKELRPLSFRLRGVDGDHRHLAARGISTRTTAAFGIGFYAGPGLLSRRVVMPIHDEGGRLVAYCGRSLDGTEPRYRFPAGFAKSQVLFNLHRAAAEGEEAVIVVEGLFDCLKVHQAGFRSVVALMGSALYERQRRLLTERFRQIVLMLDGDQTGRRASETIAARLAGWVAVRVIELAAAAQPDQLSESAIQEILAKEGGKSKSW